MFVRTYVVISGKYAAFVPRAKLTTREATALVKMIKGNWCDNIEMKNVWQFEGCSVFGEASAYTKSSHKATRNATIVAIENSMVVTMSRNDYLVSDFCAAAYFTVSMPPNV